MKAVLMVCLGNICRSPLAEGILKHKVSQSGLDIKVDSAGTAAYHAGEPPDYRSQGVAEINGVNLGNQRARKFEVRDFDRFDKIYVMDRSNFKDIIALARNQGDREKVEMIMNLAYPGENRQVPDPYYGGKDGFQQVFDMLNAACDQIIGEI